MLLKPSGGGYVEEKITLRRPHGRGRIKGKHSTGATSPVSQLALKYQAWEQEETPSADTLLYMCWV